MKLIHASDIHLSSEFITLDSEQRKIRLNELNSQFAKMVDYAKANDVKAILLAGDVFDNDHPSASIKSYFYSVIKDYPEINFYYLKGNHDIDNIFNENLPNLFTFNSEKITTYYLDNIAISGIEINSDNYSSIYDLINLNDKYFNILLLHGQVANQEKYDAINIKKIAKKNIDYLALGHIHSFYEGKIEDNGGVYVNPGCLEGRGFDESGQKGFVLLEINNQNINYNFIPFSKREIIVRHIDISHVREYYELEKLLKNEIANIDKANIVRIILIGEREYDFNYLHDILPMLKECFFYVEVKDETKIKIDYHEYLLDQSIIGIFVRNVLNETKYNQKEKKDIIDTGIKILKGENK